MNPAKLLVTLGIVLIVAGLLWTVGARFGLGRLPGDMTIRREHWTLYFPLTTCLLLSVLLSLVVWVIGRFGR